MKKTRKKNHINSKTYRMYRRMKNILGASLVILSIVIAQIPMGDVNAEGAEIKFNTLIEGWTVASQTTSTAQTVTEPVSITIPKNGDASDAESVTLTVGEKYSYINNRTNPVSKTDYIFQGWYREKDFYTKVDFTQQYTDSTTFYAKWTTEESVSHSVSFQCDGATNSSSFSEISITTNNTDGLKPIDKPTVVPLRPGYTFREWRENGAEQEYDWSQGITRDIILYAFWDTASGVTVNFDYNGGINESAENDSEKSGVSVQVDTDQALELDQFPNEEILTYKNGDITYDLELKTWYLDTDCLNQHLTSETNPQTVTFSSNTTLYKKWYYYTLDGTTKNTKNEGFCLNPDGTVLYKFVRPESVQNIVIPEKVKCIGTDAFSSDDDDLQNLKSIQLPSTVTDIRENAFSFAAKLEKDVDLIAQTNATTATQFAKTLAEKYEHLKYKSTAGGGDQPTEATFEVRCSLNEVNSATGPSGVPTYPTATAPADLSSGHYYLTLSDDGVQDVIHHLLAADSRTSAVDQTANVYFMDISLTKQNSTDHITFASSMSITMPIPSTWQSKNSEYIDVFCVDSAGTTLEKVTDFITTLNGVPAIGFYPKHFSEYALVYQASAAGESYLVTVNHGTGGGTYAPGVTVTVTADAPQDGYEFDNWTVSGASIQLSSTTASTATFTMPSGEVTLTANYKKTSDSDNDNDDDGGGGGGSSGGSSGGSHSGGSSSGGSSGGSSSTGGANSLDALAGLANGTTGIGGGTTGGTGGAIGAGGSGGASGSSTGTTHTKDATPKTGDPLEYKTLFVCGCFSLGVLLLLTGNKKKELRVS